MQPDTSVKPNQVNTVNTDYSSVNEAVQNFDYEETRAPFNIGERMP